MMRFASCCSGIEAASVAWPFWQAAWFSEIEPFPCAVLKHHYPEVPNHGDMTTLPDRILSGEVEAPDVFCGGTPCQAFSVAGNRKSLDDARGNLSLTFCEIADAIDAVRYVRNEQPAIIFYENVPGVLNTADNAFGCLLAKLAGESCELQPPGGRWTDAGCVHGPKRTIAWRVLDAQYFGLAQRRRRVFIVASSRKGFNPSEVLFEFDGLRRDTAPSRQARQGIAADAESGIKWPADVASTLNAAFGSKQGLEDQHINGGAPLFVPHPVGYDAFQHHGWRESDTIGTLTANLSRGICGDSPLVAEAVCAEISPTVTNGPPFSRTENERVECEALVVNPPHAFKIRGGCDGGGKGYLGQDEQAFTITTGHDQQVAVAFHAEAQADQLPSSSRDTSISDPLTCSQHAAVATQYAVRRLTPVECERLQGFPDNYTNIPWRNKPESPDGPRYKALGNSWAVPCVTWIGERINEAVK